jgi:pilus assembly protein FimV
VIESAELESTQQISAEASKSPTPDDDSDNADEMFDLPDLPDDIGDELKFSMDDDDAASPGDAELADDEGGEFGMLDDLDLEDFDADEIDQPGDDDVALDFGMDDEDDADDDLESEDALKLGDAEDDGMFAKTEIVTPNYDDTAAVQLDDDLGDDADDGLTAGDEDGINLGMEDTAMKASEDLINDTGEFVLDVEDEAEDISIIDFGGDDFEEPTEKISTTSNSDLDDEDDDDSDFVLDDEDEQDAKTGTFAPGDFDEPTAAVDSLADLDDMDDLMLPDDVDEVSTKLDLARAFIDMGDTEGARGSLEEVMSEGNAEQKAEAKTLLDQI